MVAELDAGWIFPTGMMTVERFGAEYGVGKTKAYELLNAGALRACTIDGTMTRIRRIDAEMWAASLPGYDPKDHSRSSIKRARHPAPDAPELERPTRHPLQRK